MNTTLMNLETAAWDAAARYEDKPSIQTLNDARRAYITYAESVVQHARSGALINGKRYPFVAYAEACLSEMPSESR